MKKLLITGASTGIGAETARLLAPGNLGTLVHYGSSQQKAEGVAAEVERLGGKAVLLRADLTTEAACLRLVEALGAHTDSLDVLVNNAGGLVRRQPARELSWDLMLETYSLNTFSAMKIASLCIPLLEKGTDPSIVNVTSVVVRHGGPTATIYASSKGALDVFSRGLCKELAPRIRVNSVSPGVIETPFHEKVSTPEQMRNWGEANPLKRNGKPLNIALAIKYAIENDFVNGESIDVNGGLWMR